MAYRRVVRKGPVVWIAAFLLVGILVISAYGSYIDLELAALGSILTFIYGFFMHGLFKFIDRKYTAYKNFIGDLSGYIESIYNLARLTGNAALKKHVREAFIAFFKDLDRLPPWEYQKTQKHIYKMYDAIGTYSPRSKKQGNLHNRMLEHMGKISSTREKLELFGDKYLVGETRFVFLLSTVLLIGMLLVLSISLSPVLIIIVWLLIVLVLFIAHLMYILDNLSYGRTAIRGRNFQQIIDYMQSE